MVTNPEFPPFLNERTWRMHSGMLDQAEADGILVPERPLHTVVHFGKAYQWFRRADGRLTMRKLDDEKVVDGFGQPMRFGHLPPKRERGL